MFTKLTTTKIADVKITFWSEFQIGANILGAELCPKSHPFHCDSVRGTTRCTFALVILS